MKQLTLDIRPDSAPEFENFVPGANADLLDCLRSLAAGSAAGPVYLWGSPGSGRSHLLHACCSASARAGRPAHYVAATRAGSTLPEAAGALVAVDEVEQLTEASQGALFRSFNAAGQRGQRLLLAGAAPPRALGLREDLRTRIGAALIFEVKPLTDEEKAATLAAHAARRGMRLEPELLRYLLHHGRRELPWLLAALDALDRASLEQKRPLTLPLLKEVLRPPASQ
jgi:DnaA family protein